VRIRLFTVVTVSLVSLLAPAQDLGKPATHADRVLVIKKERTLELISHGKMIHSYKIALGGNPVGAKTMLGDHKTPEGLYLLDSRNAHSRFYKSIHISYPSAQDRADARRKGVSPGGEVFIHGLPKGYAWLGTSHRLKDWTDGCIAVTNEEMDQIWLAVTDGTPIEIRP